MSGHLANLLERAAERTPLLQRRRRSLFEPAEGMMDLSTSVIAPAPAAEVGTMPAQPPQPAAVAPPVPPQAQSAAVERGAADSAALRPAPLSQPSVSVSDNAAPRRATQETAQPATAPAIAVTAISPALPPAATAAAAPRLPGTEAPLLRRAAIGADAEASQPLPARSTRREPREADPPRAAAPELAALLPTAIANNKPAATATPPPAATLQREPVPAALRPAAPAVAALRATAVAQPPAPAAPAAPPAVNIHIGRIELRATAPAAAERAARPAAPKLGLADYLRARHGGRP